MKTIRFADDTAVPALGQGTWMMAEDPARRSDEIAALRKGLSLGLPLIDTAEMYADGGSERLASDNGTALFPRRIHRRLAMFGRQDNVNLCLLYSDKPDRGDEAMRIMDPEHT